MTTEVLDRRAAIEAAFEATEKEETPVETVEVAPVEPASSESTPTEAKSTGQISPDSDPSPTTNPVKATEAPSETVEKPLPVEKAPQSWRAPQKAKWGTIDPEVRQEIMRRERDITKTLGEVSQAKQFTQQFQSTIQPYMPRLQATGMNPLNAVKELLHADHILNSAPKTQRAQYMARLIKDYQVDVSELDAALAGQVTADPVASKVESLLAERLAPLQQFLTRQQQAELAAQQQQQQQYAQTIETMANDPKFEYFNDVRQDMADIIDLQAKKGVYLSLEQAYTRAIAMNPDIHQLVTNKQMGNARSQSALAANAKAQKALAASKSVGGAPNGSVSGASGLLDRRATIAAAFEAANGR
jgi:hypothetical protein